jgi:hypothetical protein
VTVVDRGQDVVGRGELCCLWEDHFKAVEVSALGGIGNGVGDDGQFVASFVGGSGSGLDDYAGEGPSEDDPGVPVAVNRVASAPSGSKGP